MTPIRMDMVRQHAAILDGARSLLRAQDHRPRPVAEQDAGRAVGPVEDSGKGLGADDERGFRLAEADEVVRHVQRIDEPGADRLDVEGGAPGHAERVLDPRRGCREGLVRGRRRDDDQVEIGRLHPGPDESGAGGGGRQVGGEFPLGGDAAFENAGALDDPIVGGVHHPREVFVAEHLLGQIPAVTGDDGPGDHQDAAARVRTGIDSEPPSSCAVIFSLKRWAAMSTATPMALAKPNASVEPWLLTTVPLRPRNIAPL